MVTSRNVRTAARKGAAKEPGNGEHLRYFGHHVSERRNQNNGSAFDQALAKSRRRLSDHNRSSTCRSRGDLLAWSADYVEVSEGWRSGGRWLLPMPCSARMGEPRSLLERQPATSKTALGTRHERSKGMLRYRSRGSGTPYRKVFHLYSRSVDRPGSF